MVSDTHLIFECLKHYYTFNYGETVARIRLVFRDGDRIGIVNVIHLKFFNQRMGIVAFCSCHY